MKSLLMKKQAELQKSLSQLEQQYNNAMEQIIMHKGALQHNAVLLKELEATALAEVSPALPAPTE